MCIHFSFLFKKIPLMLSTSSAPHVHEQYVHVQISSTQICISSGCSVSHMMHHPPSTGLWVRTDKHSHLYLFFTGYKLEYPQRCVYPQNMV